MPIVSGKYLPLHSHNPPLGHLFCSRKTSGDRGCPKIPSAPFTRSSISKSFRKVRTSGYLLNELSMQGWFEKWSVVKKCTSQNLKSTMFIHVHPVFFQIKMATLVPSPKKPGNRPHVVHFPTANKSSLEDRQLSRSWVEDHGHV